MIRIFPFSSTYSTSSVAAAFLFILLLLPLSAGVVLLLVAEVLVVEAVVAVDVVIATSPPPPPPLWKYLEARTRNARLAAMVAFSPDDVDVCACCCELLRCCS